MRFLLMSILPLKFRKAEFYYLIEPSLGEISLEVGYYQPILLIAVLYIKLYVDT